MLLSALLICLIYSVIGIPQAWFSKQQSCGISKYPDAGEYDLPKPFIVGGIKAKPNEFPWQARVNGCGGSIINERWVLTAAHCTRFGRPDMVFGDHILNIHNPNRQKIGAEKIFNHPNYGKLPERSFDISLVKTKQAIKFNANVRPICLPEPNKLYEGRKAVVSGWGHTQHDGENSNVLLYTTLNITTNEYCQSIYLNHTISNDMICATDNMNNTKRDSCQNDSGGPLAIKDSNGTFTIIGVVSWGDGCASRFPGVYSRVNYVLDWINETIKKN